MVLAWDKAPLRGREGGGHQPEGKQAGVVAESLRWQPEESGGRGTQTWVRAGTAGECGRRWGSGMITWGQRRLEVVRGGEGWSPSALSSLGVCFAAVFEPLRQYKASQRSCYQ